METVKVEERKFLYLQLRKKLRGHIALGCFVQPFICASIKKQKVRVSINGFIIKLKLSESDYSPAAAHLVP